MNRYHAKAKRWREKRQCIATTLSDFVGFAWENVAKSHPNSFARLTQGSELMEVIGGLDQD